ITTGATETTFEPDAVCTRGQIVTFLYRAADAYAEAAESFADVSADAYYAPAVAWAVAVGITNGTSDTTFSPDSPCTRGQVVTFLYRNA
ncbi:MAG: S-layer homology domain-containing protein, partial [Oscillospiraceae bacterium]|nr:S-layer homology domain-containing protein [Oscillospiraceae bacterium]